CGAGRRQGCHLSLATRPARATGDRRDAIMTDFDQAKAEDAWGSLGSGAGGDAVEPRAIHDFVIHLQEEKIHPILMFGTSRSGKALMMLSLMHYAKQNPRGNMRIRLGDAVFP